MTLSCRWTRYSFCGRLCTVQMLPHITIWTTLDKLMSSFIVNFSVLAGESAVVLSIVADQLQALNERVHSFAFDIVFIQIRQQLAQTPKLQVRLCFLISYWIG